MSNRNHKIASMESSLPLDKQPEAEQQKWLEEHPTRGEVTQFVSGYINNEVIPVILNSVGKELFQLRCRNEVLLKFAIESGACTAEQYEEEYKNYMKQQQEEIRKHQEQVMKEQESSASKIIVPDKTIIH